MEQRSPLRKKQPPRAPSGLVKGAGTCTRIGEQEWNRIQNLLDEKKDRYKITFSALEKSFDIHYNVPGDFAPAAMTFPGYDCAVLPVRNRGEIPGSGNAS